VVTFVKDLFQSALMQILPRVVTEVPNISFVIRLIDEFFERLSALLSTSTPAVTVSQQETDDQRMEDGSELNRVKIYI
jgi:hypothetical protein